MFKQAIITGNEYRRDLINTEKELNAYRALSEAYYVLYSLPENPISNGVYFGRAISYQHKYDNCNEFYKKLKAVKLCETHDIVMDKNNHCSLCDENK